MKPTLFTILLILLPFSLQGLPTFTQANEAYHNKDFSRAIKLYKESLIESQSLEQHLNLANAYYENKDYAHAILHYEKALIFAPRNPLILKNINLTNEALEIHVDPPSIFENLAHLLSANIWSWILISALALGLLLFILSLLITDSLFIKITLWICTFIIVICVVLHIFYSRELNTAIILTNNPPLRVSPTSASPITILLRAGSKIHITKAKQSIPNWALIKTLKNQEGWINTEDFGLIWQ